MKYKVSFKFYGSECTAGVISNSIWKYIQKECGGNVGTYREKLDAGEVPEKFKLAEDVGSFCDVDDLFHAYGAYKNDKIEVYAEDKEQPGEFDDIDPVATLEFDDVADFYNDDVDVDFALRDTKSKHYFVWESFEKGEWNAVIETDEPFDQSKLILNFKCLIYEDGEQEKWLVTSVQYGDDDKEYDIEPCTEGKSYELSFHTVRC